MVKNGEETAKKEGKTTGNVLPVLLGTGTGLVLLLLLTLLAAGLMVLLARKRKEDGTNV